MCHVERVPLVRDYTTVLPTYRRERRGGNALHVAVRCRRNGKMPIYPEGRGPLDYMRRLARGLLPAFQCPEISPRHHSGSSSCCPRPFLGREGRGQTPSLSPHTPGGQAAREVFLNPGSEIHPQARVGGEEEEGGIRCGPTAACRLLPAVCLRDPERLDTPVPVVRVLVRGLPTFPFRPRSANTHTHTHTHTHTNVGSHCAASKPPCYCLVLFV